MKKFLKFFDFSLTLSLFSMLALLLFAANAKAAETDARINRYVIAVSANYGGSGRPMLRYAESDAKSFAQVLKEMGGVQSQNILLVKEPSILKLQQEMDRLDEKIASNKSREGRNEVLVYYSGHADDKGLLLGNETLVWKALRSRVDSLHADVKIAVIDACGSGAITRAKGGVSVPAFMMDASSDMKGYAFITSSTQDESSQESDKLQGSFFTHSLVSGLRGAGDLSGDGKVTLSEAYQFAFNETLQKTQSTMGGAQHPSRDMNLAGTGDVVMTDLRSMNAGIVFDKPMEGRIFVRDDHGELVVELYKRADRELELGLAAGKYSVQLEVPPKNLVCEVNVSAGRRESVNSSAFHEAGREKTVSRGEIRSEEQNVRFDSLDHSGKFRTTFNFVDRDKEPRKGMMLGLFLTRTDDIMLGTQLSVIGNIAKKEIHGLQVSSVFNVAAGKIEGLQLSSTLNLARSFHGIQVGSINMVKDASNGAQFGAINLAGDSVSMAQIGSVNFGRYSMAQVGAVNVAKNTHVQVGAVNLAIENEKASIGAVNVVAKSHGRQWGVINIIGNAEKTPVGLINFVGNGVWNAMCFVNELGAAAVSARFGTAAYFMTLETSRLFEKGANFKHFNDVYEYGFGIGTQFGRYGSHFELEYMFLNVSDHFNTNTKINVNSDDVKMKYVADSEVEFHHRLRLGFVTSIVKGLGLTVGGTLNIATQGLADKVSIAPMGEWHDDWHFDDDVVRFWPGLYAGLVVGRF